jgi:D-amino-acid dehydrogenase
VDAAVEIHGQRYLDPSEFVTGLASTVQDRGGKIVQGAEITDVEHRAGGVTVITAEGDGLSHDAVVLATGADLDALAARFGVRHPVRAARGHSFSVAVETLPRGPLYFPRQLVACTPLGDRVRVSGGMEFRRPGDPLDPRRTTAIADAIRPFVTGVDLDDRRDEWVGSRPCTADGLPLLGGTASPRVFVAGGHGMWGVTLGPVTGQLIAQTVLKGEAPPELAPFDPLR